MWLSKLCLITFLTLASSSIFQLPPQITKQPKSDVILNGKEKIIILECEAIGVPTPYFQWTKNGVDFNFYAFDDRMIQEPGKGTLIIFDLRDEDAGQYQCFAENNHGIATSNSATVKNSYIQSSSINVDIQAIPHFTVEPERVVAGEGEYVEFNCEASGIPEPTINWIHNGKSIEDAEKNSRRVVTKNKITIEDVKKEDTGNYGCNASNEHGYVYKDVYVNVVDLPPKIEYSEEEISVLYQHDAMINCKVSGAPKPTVKWYRRGNELRGDQYEIQSNGSLFIKEVEYYQDAKYTCYAENDFGTDQADRRLRVFEPTKIVREPQDMEVMAGDWPTFECDISSDSSANVNVKWLLNGQEIDFKENPRFKKSSDHSLTITNTIELDTGKYTCRAITAFDSVEASATLTVQGVPNAPAITNIQCNANEAIISWESKGDNRSPIINFVVQYKTAFDEENWIDTDEISLTGFTHKISMSPWADYTFRVIAVNKVGSSEPSEESKSCTSPADVPHKNPDYIEGMGTEPTNFVIKWKPMSQIDHNGPKFHYRVSWKRDVKGEWNTREIYDWKNSEFIITDQPTYQRYKIKVQAVNELGVSKMDVEEIDGYSGEDKPLEAPRNLSLYHIINGKTAVVSWNGVSPESVRGYFGGYKIKMWAEDDESNVKVIIVSPTASKALIDNFTPNTKNFARILAINNRFEGPLSDIISFDMPEGVPEAVQSLNAYKLGTYSLWLKWKKPLKTNGKLNGYRIYYETVDRTEFGPRQEKLPRIADPNQTSAKLTGLTPEIKYRIHVVGYTESGDGDDYYIEEEIKIDNEGMRSPDEPSLKLELQPSENSFARVKVTWIPNVSGNNPGTHFFVQYRKDGESEFQRTDDVIFEDFIIVDGLDCNERYQFEVVALNWFTSYSDTKFIDT